MYHLDLDFFGPNCRLTDAKSRFHLVSGAENLKILHIRRGPHDGVLDLLNCMFGPKGLPKLDFVAYGDFTTSSQPRRSRQFFRRVRQPSVALSGHHWASQVRYENIADEEIDTLPDMSCFLTSLKACYLGE